MKGGSTELLTVEQLCGELQIARSTFYEWRMKRRGPRCLRLPNNTLRIRREDLDAWLESPDREATFPRP